MFGINTATAQTIFALKIDGNEPILFSGEVSGQIVDPKGTYKFGWDAIFKPDGYDTTYGQMSDEVKITMSHRSKALQKLI